MADNLRAQAEQFCQSYANAVNCTDANKTEEAVRAIFSHYVKKGFVSFSLGSINQLNDLGEAVPKAKVYLDRWFTAGIGLDVRLESTRIEVVSQDNALCFLTWKAHPFSLCEKEPWTFENVYSYRLSAGSEIGTGAFEFAISDNETGALVQRFPNFFS